MSKPSEVSRGRPQLLALHVHHPPRHRLGILCSRACRASDMARVTWSGIVQCWLPQKHYVKCSPLGWLALNLWWWDNIVAKRRGSRIIHLGRQDAPMRWGFLGNHWTCLGILVFLCKLWMVLVYWVVQVPGMECVWPLYRMSGQNYVLILWYVSCTNTPLRWLFQRSGGSLSALGYIWEHNCQKSSKLMCRGPVHHR